MSGPFDVLAPVYFVDAQDPQQAHEPKCASIKAMVELWTDALAHGLWRWDDATRNWEIADGTPVAGDSAAVLFG